MNAPQLHEWLADSLLHGTVFLGIALVSERLLRRRSAARRHALLLGAALGMTSAFRTAAVAQETTAPKASGEVVLRTYELVDSQLRQLVSIEDPYSVGEFDPDAFAAETRQKLVENFGLRIRSADPVKIHFPGKFRLEVSAPASLQDDIAWALDSMIDGDQIEVQLHVFELDDPKWISERIGKGNEQGSIMTPAEFATLRKEITERGGIPKTVPKVITRVGQRAKIEMIREFIYPTEYDPPQLLRADEKKEDLKDNEKAAEEALVKGVALDNAVFGVTPANPTAFEMRPVGLTWETDPTITRDGSINMGSIIEDTQFLGFINYGSPIRGKGQGLFKKPIVLTENRIEQPIFEMERLATRITMAPGTFVALRGFRPDSNPPLNVDTVNTRLPDQPPLTKRAYRIYVIEARVVPRK